MATTSVTRISGVIAITQSPATYPNADLRVGSQGAPPTMAFALIWLADALRTA